MPGLRDLRNRLWFVKTTAYFLFLFDTFVRRTPEEEIFARKILQRVDQAIRRRITDGVRAEEPEFAIAL